MEYDDEETPVDPDADEKLAALIADANQHGFNRVLGFELDAVGDDWARATVPHNPEYTNPLSDGVMHGGVAASTLDTVLGYAIIANLYDAEDRRIGPTISLNVNFVATASESLVATGEVTRLGKTNALAEGEIRGAETDKTVATGQGVWRIFNDRE